MKKPWIIGPGVLFLIIAILSVIQKPPVKRIEKETRQTTISEMLRSDRDGNVDEELIQYYEGSLGYFVKPKKEGYYPGVVMIHEWWGLNKNIKEMAEQLASKGYIVMAVDLYYGKVAQTVDEARELVTALNEEKALENMKAAVEFLRKNGAVKIASLGWCFGGGQSLQLALSGQELDATVLYYGSLETDSEKLSAINWPVLGIFGDQDTSIPVETVNSFDSALDTLNIENEIYIYPGVGHAFANPSGQNYAQEETEDAWEKTLAFLDKHLKK
ncbi:hypothetical protein A3A69_02080 [candidate division WWE3 bacterium RIFCSPLOWO2_01_FULL_37_15]|uniref:Dienelactone hydrolase domain-containing protein n=1 Tax=candidate division WWE3 bacterium RIFCSPLOWO2_01_FULL_37_15 TaxID=1802622 RepID=A0A1F4UVD1_UNCKA|nr:MAG: hypothetical protein A3A69_02080 [candidate division WWE3 bacterium RIFCSPLOWO2_01_FULL_37_15]